jgi:polysaccharide export outer membrane protein
LGEGAGTVRGYKEFGSMARKHSARPYSMFWIVLGTCAATVGCHTLRCGKSDIAEGSPRARLLAPCRTIPAEPPPDVPRELSKVDLPEYVIEAPDVLVIDAARTVPLPPYHVAPLDALAIVVPETLADQQPISGVYPVSPEGGVDLGFSYGQVPLVGLTLEAAKAALQTRLKPTLKPGFQVSVSLAQSRGAQQIRGEHLVRGDGTVALGLYGAVKVSGLTTRQAKAAVEAYLSRYLLNPEVSLDVAGFNSKRYYVITDGGGAGEQVIRLPLQGSETVLDAISQINGLSAVSSKCIWVVRPTPAEAGYEEVLPVDWVGITQHGLTATNYQLAPGDRVYVKAQDLIVLDTFLARVISPIERVFGILLLGNTTVRAYGPRGGSTGGAGVPAIP